MRETKQNKLLDCIHTAYEQTQGLSLYYEVTDLADFPLQKLAAYLKVTKFQALLASIVFVLGLTRKTVSIFKVNEHFNSHILKIGQFSDDFEVLVSRKILICNEKLGSDKKQSYIQYAFNPELTKCLKQNKPLPAFDIPEYQCTGQVFDMARKYIMYSELNVYSNAVTKQKIFNLFVDNQYLSSVRSILDYFSDPNELYKLVTHVLDRKGTIECSGAIDAKHSSQILRKQIAIFKN